MEFAILAKEQLFGKQHKYTTDKRQESFAATSAVDSFMPRETAIDFSNLLRKITFF